MHPDLLCNQVHMAISPNLSGMEIPMFASIVGVTRPQENTFISVYLSIGRVSWIDEVDVHQANYGFLFNESLRTTRQLAVCKSKRGDVVGAEEKTHGAYVVVWTMLLLVSEIEYSGPFCSDLNLFNLLASCAIKSYCGDGKLKTMFYSRRRNAKHESAQATVRKCSHEALCFQGFSRCNSICVVHAEPSPGIFSIQGLPRPTKKSVHHNNSSANLGPRNSAQRGCENNVDQNQGAELEYSFPCQCERCALVVHAKSLIVDDDEPAGKDAVTSCFRRYQAAHVHNGSYTTDVLDRRQPNIVKGGTHMKSNAIPMGKESKTNGVITIPLGEVSGLNMWSASTLEDWLRNDSGDNPDTMDHSCVTKMASLRRNKHPDDDDTDGMYGFRRATKICSQGGPKRLARKTSVLGHPESETSNHQVSDSTAVAKQRISPITKSTLATWKAVIERTCNARYNLDHVSDAAQRHCSDDIEPKPGGGDLTVEYDLSRAQRLCV